jgi:hypothetical protein
MTTSSGISASMASMMASLANFGGTKMIDTSAPVFSIASATLPNTGKLDVLALFGLVRDGGARLARVHAADNLSARLEHAGSVHGGLATGDALDDDLAVFESGR